MKLVYLPFRKKKSVGRRRVSWRNSILAQEDCFKDDGEDEFDPLLEDEDDDEEEEEEEKRRMKEVRFGAELLYIGSLKKYIQTKKNPFL